MSRIPPDQFAEQIRLRRVEWARLDGIARRLEELKPIKEAELFNQAEGAMDLRKAQARAHPTYREHIEEMVEARTKANIQLAAVLGMETEWKTWQSRNASRRAEMQIR